MLEADPSNSGTCMLELMLLVAKSRYIVFEFDFFSTSSFYLSFNGYQVIKVLGGLFSSISVIFIIGLFVHI